MSDALGRCIQTVASPVSAQGPRFPPFAAELARNFYIAVGCPGRGRLSWPPCPFWLVEMLLTAPRMA